MRFASSPMEVKKWDDIQEGQLIGVKGEAESFNNSVSIKIAAIAFNPPTAATNEDFIPSESEAQIQTAKTIITDFIENMKNPYLKGMCVLSQEWFNNFYESPTEPACYYKKGGLAVHVSHLLDYFSTEDGPLREVLGCTAILHDIGQCHSYTMTNVVLHSSKLSVLLPPSMLSLQAISAIAVEAQTPNFLRRIIESCVVASHGLGAYGSPEALMFANIHELSDSMHEVKESMTKKDKDGLFYHQGAKMLCYEYPKEDGWE